MDHVGIDLGSKESQICVRSADGEIVVEGRWRTARLVTFLQERPPARVIVESAPRPSVWPRSHNVSATMYVSLPPPWCGRWAWGTAG